MELGSLLFLLLLLACPIAMVWMMRGGHGGHGHAGHGHASHGLGHGCGHGHGETTSAEEIEELRQRRDELDAEIARLEEVASRTTTPTAA